MHSKMKKTWHTLTADKRRFGLFCALLFVGLLLWARIIVIARPARTAIATPFIETNVATILTSDKVTIPVFLETEPVRNPFAIHVDTFPDQGEQTDNNSTFKPLPMNSGESAFVASLKLEAVMGEMAMINGQVVKIGDIIGPKTTSEPLRFEELQGRTVIISAGERRYELSITPLHH